MKPRMIRDDLSDKLIHLTRGDADEDAARVFESIVKDRKLTGGSGCIKGGFNCVCFSEAPLGKLSLILASPMAHGMRYSPFGVMVDKKWLFERGGRPVIYQSDAEFELLNPEQQWRHVRYEPQNGIDFTWEREWRIKTTVLDIDLDSATLVIPNRKWEKRFHDEHMGSMNIANLVTRGFSTSKDQKKIPWHFVVLEDLGVEIPDSSPEI